MSVPTATMLLADAGPGLGEALLIEFCIHLALFTALIALLLSGFNGRRRGAKLTVCLFFCLAYLLYLGQHNMLYSLGNNAYGLFGHLWVIPALVLLTALGRLVQLVVTGAWKWLSGPDGH